MKRKPKHVLVTGGAGYIGSTLVRELLRKNYEVTAIDSLRDGTGESLLAILEEPNFNFVKDDIRSTSRIAKALDDIDTIVRGEDTHLHAALTRKYDDKFIAGIKNIVLRPTESAKYQYLMGWNRWKIRRASLWRVLMSTFLYLRPYLLVGYLKARLGGSKYFGRKREVKLELYHLPFGEFLGDTVHRWHRFEYPVQRHLMVDRGDVVFDIGAHQGYYTLKFSKLVGDIGLVVAVEPHPMNLKILRRNIALNNLGNVRVLPCAISDKNGKIKLYLGAHSGLHTILKNSGFGSITVETMTLASLLSSFSRVNLLKMDIEGAERLVLNASTLLGRVDKYVIETHSKENMKSLIKLFQERNYEVELCKGSGRRKWIIARRRDFISASK